MQEAANPQVEIARFTQEQKQQLSSRWQASEMEGGKRECAMAMAEDIPCIVVEGLREGEPLYQKMGVYERMDGKELNERAVWQRSGHSGGEELFLFYLGKCWYIGNQDGMGAAKASVWMRSVSDAPTPNMVQGTWYLHDGLEWSASQVVARTSLHYVAAKFDANTCVRLMDEGIVSIQSLSTRTDDVVHLDRRLRSTTPLHVVACKAHIQHCHLFIKWGAEIDARDAEKQTPLHLAASNGHADVCAILVESGAHMDTKDSFEHLPLHLAACNGHISVCVALVEAGAEVDAPAASGQTPLHFAAQEGYAGVCQQLLAVGANVDAQTTEQNTPLHLSASYESVDASRVLVRSGAKVNARNTYQQVPLHLAAESFSAEVCRLLNAVGAEVDARDNEQQVSRIQVQ
jgi:ankyrin repeat protein